MKKAAFILALVLCLSLVLVACDNAPADESTPADTSAPADESKPADESADESTPAEESGGAVVPSETNIAAGKAYTTSTLYRQGGADVEWQWDENAAITYPDEDGKSLTDGLVLPATDSFQDPVWAGFSANCPDYGDTGFSYITIDLGEATHVALVKVGVATGMFADVGITAPTTVEVAFSDDGENWSDSVIATPVNAVDVACEVVEIPVNDTAKFVQVRTTGSGWMFVSEVEIYPAK